MRNNNKGFTLVELMVSIAMTGIIATAIYAAYTLHQRTSTAQEQVVEMQQNIRAAMLTIMPEIRMAGFDPLDSGKAAIEEAYGDAIYFTADLNTDGNVSVGGDDVGEHIAFDLYTNGNGVSILGMTRAKTAITINNMGAGHYEVDPPNSTSPSHQPIAENIEAIQFQYRDIDDNLLAVPVATPSDIHTVTISILARASWQDTKFTNNTVYTPAPGVAWDLNGVAAGTANPPNDSYRRRLLISSVQCRNMGL